MWVAIPARLADSGIPQVFATLATLLPQEELQSLKQSGMYALSAPGRLEEALAAAQMSHTSDETIPAPSVFPDAATAVDAFLSAGATALAIRHAGQRAVESALHSALEPFRADDGRLTLPGWFRVVQAG